MKAKDILKTGLLLVSRRAFNFIRYRKFNWLNREKVQRHGLESEMLLLRDLLPKDAVFFDIGANTGEYVYLASNFIPHRNIFAFEPNPTLFSDLARSFPRVNLLEYALSSQVRSEQAFKIPVISGREFESRGTLNVNYVEEDEERRRMITVKTWTLDSFVAKQNLLRLDLIKIDVEGHEEEVVRGAQRTLRNLRPYLIIEIEQRHHNTDINEFIRSLESLNYACYFLTRDFQLEKTKADVRLLQPSDPAQKKTRGYINNFVFAPIEKPDRLGKWRTDKS